ncbi:PTS sugar transporter subunit IIA [Robertmurraya andreesenii]|uniref:PTS system glucose-specific IIA component n=1 Tax=Anoxybacillus andreesenii TaxID=1325932 RepID=A0ABT9V2W3_9BACL|nr:PTS glucose transporter subunit IIA [Robertmurraya andreesenii]MDQ0155293.1 PTS system glucose-specific IIA component [Robertmurraya andreesenii]
MFSKLFKKQPLQVYAPVKGELVSLEKVPDPVFSEKMMGEGLAIVPSEGRISSPVEGTIILVADTKHAVGIQANDGTELLIHIGLETVALGGEGFNTHVKAGDKVSVGQLLIEVDLAFISEHAKSTVTPIVVTNSQDRTIQYMEINGYVSGESIIMSITK